MTRQELTERLRRSRGMSDYEHQADDREAVAALDALRAELDRCVEHLRSSVADEEARQREIDALRCLPVITMCGDCGHLGGGYPDATCTHIDAGADEPPTVEHEAPPEWCPLRGGQR